MANRRTGPSGPPGECKKDDRLRKDFTARSCGIGNFVFAGGRGELDYGADAGSVRCEPCGASVVYAAVLLVVVVGANFLVAVGCGTVLLVVVDRVHGCGLAAGRVTRYQPTSTTMSG